MISSYRLPARAAVFVMPLLLSILMTFVVSGIATLRTLGLTPAEALELTVESFRFMAGFEGAVPGASEVECGNYRDMDLPAAKAEAAAMLPVLEALTGDELHY